MSRLLKVLARALAALLVAVAVLGAVTGTGRYIARAAWEEGKILARRRAITELLADTATPPATAARLRVVADARRFAMERLGLSAGESFTAFSQLERDSLVLVLSAARRDTLAARTWWFPVVGSFPYKGFFDFAEADRTAAELRREGFDTWLRPAAAFSTLGWFNDPLLSTTLRQDSTDLANTVIHELVHNTLFVKGSVPFNESFASFVGARGAAAFFRSRGAERAARRVELEWEDDKQLGAFWEATARKIDSVFAIPGRDSSARIAARDSVYDHMRHVLLYEIGPRLRTVDAERLSRMQLDNAVLIARRVYASDLYLFDEVHRRSGGTLRETVGLVKSLVGGRADPYEALRGWIQEGSRRIERSTGGTGGTGSTSGTRGTGVR